jgi:hypothetical protein
VAVTPAGELWVLRGAVADEPRQIDVFSKLGDYLGTLSPDRPFPAAFPSDNRILAAELDSQQVPSLAAYRVRRR